MKYRKKNVLVKDIRQAHPGAKQYSTDVEYANLANRILDDFVRLRPDLGEYTEEIMSYAAISLASYMEDIVAETGVWQSFSMLCKELCGQDIPLYHNREGEYYHNEPNMEAVRYLIWHAAGEMDDSCWSANEECFCEMARVAYKRMDEAFEDLSINDELKEDIDLLLHDAKADFQKLRPALMWIYYNNYITRSGVSEELTQDIVDELSEMEETKIPASMKQFHAVVSSIFAYRVGPLAVKPQTYLAALMRCKGMNAEADEVEKIEMLKFSNYKLDFKDGGEWLSLSSTSGKVIRVAREEVTLSDKDLNESGTLAACFVNYQDAWHLNGILTPFGKDILQFWDEMVKEDPDYIREGTENMTGKKLLDRLGGKEIFYFSGEKDMKDFLKKKLKFNEDMLAAMKGFEGEDICPLFFVDKNAEKYAMHFCFGYTPCIADPVNPYYDSQYAKEEVMDMFYDVHNVSTALILYLLEHDFLPEIYEDETLCKDTTMDEKRSDIQFMLRNIRRDQY